MDTSEFQHTSFARLVLLLKAGATDILTSSNLALLIFLTSYIPHRQCVDVGLLYTHLFNVTNYISDKELVIIIILTLDYSSDCYEYEIV